MKQQHIDGILCRESTSESCSPSQRASDAESVSISWLYHVGLFWLQKNTVQQFWIFHHGLFEVLISFFFIN